MIDSKDSTFKFKMPCQEDAIAGILHEITTEIAKVDPEISDLEFRVEMAVREMLANAIEHGCKSSEQEIYIELQTSVSRVKIAVKDPGEGFDFDRANLNDMPVMEEKGRGLAMVNEAVDEIKFNETGNKITVYFRS